ncbi:hypothetical protein Gasu2_64480 [Galdieria sulphuraria]|nr:hypothetical protein Gasu2_64480 [Galdieria sulphuraria]
MCRSEPTLSSSIVETAFPLRAYLQFDSFSVTSDFLVKPLGVVNGILLGYVLGDPYSFALSQNWGPMVHPASRRFVLNLETQEFLEFHWYLHNNTLLANWMKFPTGKHRLRYFVLYEAPPPGKIPYKLLSSVELVLQRTESGKQQPLSASDDLFTLLPPVEQSLQSIPSALEFATLLLGTFSGTFRWTQYNPENLTVTEDELYAYSVTVCTRTHAEDLRFRELRRLCYPSLQMDKAVLDPYDKKRCLDSNENTVNSPLLCNSFQAKPTHVTSFVNGNVVPSFNSVISTDLNSSGNGQSSPSASENCQPRRPLLSTESVSDEYRSTYKRGRSVMENSGLLWTHSWNFAPQEYFESYSSNTSSTDNFYSEDKGDMESFEAYDGCDCFYGNDFFDVVKGQVSEYLHDSSNWTEFSSISSVASDFYMRRTLSGINLSEYLSSENEILTNVELPSFGSAWDSAVDSLPHDTENDIATVFLTDGDWNFASEA